MPHPRCEMQSELVQALIISACKALEAQIILDKKLGPRVYSARLQEARKEERRALVALDRHKQEHQR
jgi:hypothetical protein